MNANNSNKSVLVQEKEPVLSIVQNKVDSPSMLDAALDYATKGYAVFPVHHMNGGKCSCGKWTCSQGKHPRISKWQNKASTRVSQIKEWWAKWPDDNIGIATGQKSNLVIIDIDPRNGGDNSLQSLIDSYDDIKPSLDTHTVSTGGKGIHYYYSIDRPFKSTKKHSLGVGIDVQADGKYIIAPPSNHASGDTYSVSNTIEPVALPQILIDLIGQQQTIETDVADVLEGGRNNWLSEQAGQALRDGKAHSVVKGYLQEQNATYCKPPLDFEEVERIANSMISGYDPATSSVSLKTRWQEQIAEAKQGSTFGFICFVLSLWMDKDGGNCWPKQEDIAERCGVDRSTVGIHLEKAEKLGYLIRYKRSKRGKRGFNYGYKAVIKTQDVA